MRLDTPCDLLCGWRGVNVLGECKDAKRKARADQRAQAEWRAGWPGQIAVWTCAEEAVATMLEVTT